MTSKATIELAIAVNYRSNVDIDELGNVSFNGLRIEMGEQDEAEIADLRADLSCDGIHTDWDDDGQLVVVDANEGSSFYSEPDLGDYDDTIPEVRLPKDEDENEEWKSYSVDM